MNGVGNKRFERRTFRVQLSRLNSIVDEFNSFIFTILKIVLVLFSGHVMAAKQNDLQVTEKS